MSKEIGSGPSKGIGDSFTGDYLSRVKHLLWQTTQSGVTDGEIKPQSRLGSQVLEVIRVLQETAGD